MKAFFLTLGSVLAAVAALSFAVDPLGRRARVPEVGNLPEGHLYPARSSNDRLLKWRMLEAAPSGSTYILGSSRVLPWGTPHFPGDVHVVNLATTNGDALDDVPMITALAAKAEVKAVYIELSPWTFSASALDADPRARFSEKPAAGYSPSELLSFAVLRQAVLGLWRDDLSGRVFAESNRQRYGYRADGRFRYPEDYLRQTTEETTRVAVAFSSTPRIELLEGGLNRELIGPFCLALDEVERRGGRIVLLTVPWNPASSDRVRARKLLYSVESLHQTLAGAVESVCGRPVLRLEGLCPAAEFFDAHHPREDCFHRVQRAIGR